MNFFYGIENNYLNVTNIVFSNCINNNIINIPGGDYERSLIFGDPLIGILKNIKINDHSNSITKYFFDGENIKIDLNQVFLQNNKIAYNNFINNTLSEPEPLVKLNYLQSLLKIENCSFKEEFPEQLMAMTFINKSDKVLEIGGNLGRNAIIISNILENDQNLVTLECCDILIPKLERNKFINNLFFHIENSALSKDKLFFDPVMFSCNKSVQNSEKCMEVKTITFDDLQKKYNIQFDVLVADCEGSLPQILIDFPDLLTNINIIIMENDYLNIENKNILDNILIKNNFIRIYFEGGGWGVCQSNFFEVWKKKI